MDIPRESIVVLRKPNKACEAKVFEELTTKHVQELVGGFVRYIENYPVKGVAVAHNAEDLRSGQPRNIMVLESWVYGPVVFLRVTENEDPLSLLPEDLLAIGRSFPNG